MHNPIEGCFSILKLRIKVDIALAQENHAPPRIEDRLQRVAWRFWSATRRNNLRLVKQMALHFHQAVAAAGYMKDIQY
ncbi:hypothetical protein DVH05_017991, partial [Phytophthora capsici]